MRALLALIALLTLAAPAEAAGTKITAADSRFGTMLWGPNRQAIYVFEKDGRNRTNCKGDCAEAWPPFLASDKPSAGAGVDRALLGTVPRRDGGRQVTYAGQPLYFYEHDPKGEVLCNDIAEFGGTWFAVTAEGKKPPA